MSYITDLLRKLRIVFSRAPIFDDTFSSPLSSGSIAFALGGGDDENLEEYMDTSNTVSSILNMRGSLLTTLPLRMYKILNKERLRHSKRVSLASEFHNELSSVAASPTRFKRMIDSMKLEEVRSGALYDLIHHVNPFWTLPRLIKQTDQSLGIWGRSYWVLEYKGSVPVEIWWVKIFGYNTCYRRGGIYF